MSEIQNQIEEIEIDMKEAKEKVKAMEALNRLTANADFATIILKGYFEKEPERLVMLKADANVQDKKTQKQIMKSIDAIGSFHMYLKTTMHFGRMAQKAIHDGEQAITELYEEAS